VRKVLPETDRVRAHVRVEGHVQGVFFRTETRDRARSRGLSGWVRNDYDGTVEAVFEGDRDAVESLIRWCEQGPRGAHVEDVRVDWEDPRSDEGFDIR
jgi:acylphosphatase